tara:strand:- start:733 stop:966 length:234 start_codon:yes stop_codon:yes gene_type:complete
MIDKKNKERLIKALGIEERIKDLGSDIKIIQGQIQEIDQKRLNTIAQLNALHGAKQQCESFLTELHNDDQVEITGEE